LPRKTQTAKKFKKISQFLNRFHLLLITSKAVLYAFVYVSRDEGRKQWTFHLNIRWLMRRDAGVSSPGNGTGALLK